MIYVNIDTIRPVENICGIIQTLEKLKLKFVLFSCQKNCEQFFLGTYKVCATSNIEFKIFQKGLFDVIVFGGGMRISRFNIINAILNNFIFQCIFVPPGLIDKPVGILKYRKRTITLFFYMFRKLFIFFTRRRYILSTNPYFYDYFRKANYLPKSKCYNVELPKHLWMSSFIERRLRSDDRHILFAPTHDRDGRRNAALDELARLEDKNAKIRVSIHPQDRDKYNIPQSLLFNGDWSSVLAIVTDVSSIGFDFGHVFGGVHYRINPGLNGQLIQDKSTFGLKVHYVDSINGIAEIAVHNYDLTLVPPDNSIIELIKRISNG